MSGNSLSARLSKSQTFILALVVIVGFLIFYYIALVNACIIKSDTDGVQLVASTMGPIVASIIGYYFGQRPVQEANDRAKETKVRATNMAQDNVSELDKGDQQYQRVEDTLEKIKREYGIE